LVVDDLLTTLEHGGVKVIGYADDIAILARGIVEEEGDMTREESLANTLNEISSRIERSLRTVKNWAVARGLGVNADKTELVLFTRRYKIPDFNLPKLDGKTLALKNEEKYLGVILDSKLYWGPNVEARRKRALIAWYTCTKCFSRKWGLKPYIVKWIYTAVVRPILCYGALVWWHAARLRSRRGRLNTVQRKACLGITGAMRSTPQDALEVILNISPFRLHLRNLASKSAIRLTVSGHFISGSCIQHRSIV
ncbi:reverse transcriptase domain-containing protein, partial [Streptomyces sp. IBSBF 2390]|uniref:reverse transcriptase domain-containing protein n=1 Tax=Streptomyces sp. IBSBF 2390 TaxID=2903533 RepID=UPI002FDBD172